MCMVRRTVLIHGEARKNKSYRKKYFVVSIGPDYTKPRLDYFSSVDKWNQHKDDIYDDESESLSFRSIDLSNLFSVDDIHRSKPKQGGLDLYMEERHVSIILSSDEVKKKWKEVFDNVIYKNGKIKIFPRIEHTLQVGLRIKPKDNFDKVNLVQWKGEYRACFMKTSLMFINTSLDSPNLTIEYPFIRQWESRFDGTLRLEVGRAALIGECMLILQLADYVESKAAHSMMTNCINCFKMTRPDPPRLRTPVDKSSIRKSSFSYCRQSSGRITANACRSESCMGFIRDSSSLSGYVTNNSESTEPPQDDESNYLLMNTSQESNSKAPKNVQNYFEQISRIYKCPPCGRFTKVVTFCPKCTSTSSVSNFQQICKVEALPSNFKTKLLPSVRGKAQSLTERPLVQSLTCRTTKQKQFHSDPSKPCASQTSQSSSKTSNEMSSDSKLHSQNSSSISANRHDDEIFMELDFDNLQSGQTSAKSSKYNQSQLKCCNCSENLVHKSPVESYTTQNCSKCSEEMSSFSILIDEPESCFKDWIPRTTSLLPCTRPTGSCTSEYVEVNQGTTKVCAVFNNRYCS